MIDGKKFFDQPVRNNLITYDNIKKFVQLVVCWTIIVSKNVR